MKKAHTALIALALCTLVTGCVYRSYDFPAMTGRVVRRENGQPTPDTNALIYLSMGVHYRMNAWGVGPSTVTVRQYDYYAQPDENGAFLFPNMHGRYWSPIVFGHPRYIAPPTLTPISTKEGAWIVDVMPTNSGHYLHEGTTFHNRPFLIPTGAVFVGRGISSQRDK